MNHQLFAATAAALTVPAIPAMAQAELVLGRFFGVCEDAGPDPATALGEPCITVSIVRSFSAADNGMTVETLPAEWNNYYDQIKAA